LPQNIPLGLFGESKLKKQLLKSVDENIRRDFSERLSTSGANCPGACYHLIKTKITLMYTRNKLMVLNVSPGHVYVDMGL
jgi:hypothetical protein